MARPLLVGLLPLLLVGCSGTPLGQQLGASFDAPPPAEPQPAAKLEPAISPFQPNSPRLRSPKPPLSWPSQRKLSQKPHQTLSRSPRLNLSRPLSPATPSPIASSCGCHRRIPQHLPKR